MSGPYACRRQYIHALEALIKQGRHLTVALGVGRSARCLRPGTIRADGRKLNTMYLFEVKSPSESRHPWDYYRLVRAVLSDVAFRPLNAGGCPMLPDPNER